MSDDPKFPSWFYDFADAVAHTTLAILKPHWPEELIHPGLAMIDEAVREAVLSALHDSPINNDD
jgi:hypothetical protein